MLQQITAGVFVHESEFLQSNAVVVQGHDGVLLIDPGLTSDEMETIADDLRRLGQSVVAGFSTHPDWDHVLWHASFGDLPRYGTARGAASIQAALAKPDFSEHLAEAFPPELADEIPTDLFGLITGLPEGASRIPWDGPEARIIEHRGHAVGHAALLFEERRVLVAGDMLSDILMPFIDLEGAEPIEDYLAALRLFDGVVDSVDAVIPGHGSVGRGAEVRARIQLDRAYVEALRDGVTPDDPRIGPDAPVDWLVGVHQWQAEQLAARPQD